MDYFASLRLLACHWRLWCASKPIACQLSLSHQTSSLCLPVVSQSFWKCVHLKPLWYPWTILWKVPFLEMPLLSWKPENWEQTRKTLHADNHVAIHLAYTTLKHFLECDFARTILLSLSSVKHVFFIQARWLDSCQCCLAYKPLELSSGKLSLSFNSANWLPFLVTRETYSEVWTLSRLL